MTSSSSPYCRCCRNKNDLCDIHTVRIKKTSTTYIEMIAECVSSDISKSDILPPWLCIKCSNKLNSYYRFKQMCFKTLENLKQVNKALEKDVEKEVPNNNVEKEVLNNNVEKKVFNIDVEKKVFIIKMEEDEQENVDLHTEVFNENIVCEELNIVPQDLVGKEKVDPTNVKYEIDEVDNYLYDNHYQIYEDIEDLTCQNYEEINGESFSHTPPEMEASVNQQISSSTVNTYNNYAATLDLNIPKLNEVQREDTSQNEKELQLILQQITDKQTHCPICNNHKKIHKALLDHIKYDHFGIKYYCEICKKYFSKENRHKAIHIKDKFPCEECDEAFTNKPQFLQHIIQKHGKNGSFKCECGETFAKRRDLNTHRYMAHNKTSYKCHVCNQDFSRKDHLQHHVRRHAQGRNVRPKSKAEKKTQLMLKLISSEEIPLVRERETSCPICTKRCRTNKRLLEHIKRDHLGEKYYCKICKKYYSSELRHNNINHTTWSKCKECNKKFSVKKDYTDHMSSAHNVTQETCPHICHCGKKFQLLVQIRKHKYRVHKETDFMCQFCSKGFFKKEKLKEHVQMHTKDETFACPQCFKLFYNRSSLAKHRLRLHRTGDVYVCDYCDKVFKSKSYLKSHITAHDPSNKPHACAVCGKRFRRSDHRNNHQALVHKMERLNNM